MSAIKKNVVIFEAEGGSDKWLDGHRRDTGPIAEALKKRGWNCDILYFRDEWKDDVFNYCKDRYDAYIGRVNPGTLKNGETVFFDTLRRLSAHGLLGMPHPDVMNSLGAKDALIAFAGGLVPADTAAYYDVASLHKTFPVNMSYGERVLKQNRGSTGEGIWRVQIADDIKYQPGDSIPLDTKIKCTEAVDNHVEFRQLGEFMTFCERYIVGDNGMLVDMRFCPRIKEGEIRILLVGKKPVFVVHKKPADTADAFSATLFSGAKYTYDDPKKWQPLLDVFYDNWDTVLKLAKGYGTPLIWTADFMLDWDKDKKDTYVLGEMNCSCVGFTSHLDQGIQDMIAEEIIGRLEKPDQ